MNPELKAKWIAALRSGAYKQGQGALRISRPDGDTYCCLGVLCEVASLRAKDPEYSYTSYTYFDGESPARTALPASFLVRAGLAPVSEAELMTMNDSHGRTFSQIADHIEANL